MLDAIVCDINFGNFVSRSKSAFYDRKREKKEVTIEKKKRQRTRFVSSSVK